MPLISVIIPAYNTEKYISETIKSVLNQTMTDFELIIIDDGSSDGTNRIVAEYAAKDSRIKLITTENNGVSVARNIGIEEALGKYIAFLDSDDLWHPTFIEKMVAFIKEQNSSVVWCHSTNVKELLGTCENDKKNGKRLKLRDCVTQIGDYRGPFGIGQTLIKKIILDKYNLRFTPKMSRNEDSELNIKLFCITEITGMSDILHYYRPREGSLTHMGVISIDRLTKFVDQYTEMIAFAEKYSPDNIKLLCQMRGYKAYRVVLYILRNYDSVAALKTIEQYKEFLNDMRRYPGKINDKIKCRLFLLRNRRVLNILKKL